jgi:hypothetical protein
MDDPRSKNRQLNTPGSMLQFYKYFDQKFGEKIGAFIQDIASSCKQMITLVFKNKRPFPPRKMGQIDKNGGHNIDTPVLCQNADSQLTGHQNVDFQIVTINVSTLLIV